MKVFLGGTCNDSTWRERLIPLLKVDYFNPVVPVEEWDDACKAKEIEERKNSDFNLYCITPVMTGHLSIAEAVDDSNKHPEKTILCVLFQDDGAEFSNTQINSFKSIMRIVKENGGAVFGDLESVATYLNSKGQTV